MSRLESTLWLALAGVTLIAFFALGAEHSQGTVRLVGAGTMRVTGFSADAQYPSAFMDGMLVSRSAWMGSSLPIVRR